MRVQPYSGISYPPSTFCSVENNNYPVFFQNPWYYCTLPPRSQTGFVSLYVVSSIEGRNNFPFIILIFERKNDYDGCKFLLLQRLLFKRFNRKPYKRSRYWKYSNFFSKSKLIFCKDFNHYGNGFSKCIISCLQI